MKVTIYCLKHPTTNEIKYIGRTRKTLKDRLAAHMNCNNEPKSKAKRLYWLKELKQNKTKPLIEPIEIVEGWQNSHKRERELIEEYRLKGYSLLNMIDLGPGLEKVEGRHLTVYDLDGNKLKSFINVPSTASFIGVSIKHLENSLKRKDRAIKTFQVRDEDINKIERYRKKCYSIKRFKQISFIDVITNELLHFNSRGEAIYFFKIKKSNFYEKIQYNKLILNRYKYMPSLNSVNCLENPEKDNQQPSSCGDTEKGSTTSSESQVDNNSTTKAGQEIWYNSNEYKNYLLDPTGTQGFLNPSTFGKFEAIIS